VDTLANAENLAEIWQDHTGEFARRALLHSAAEIMRRRIAELAATYGHYLSETEDPPLSRQMLEVLVTHSESLRKDLNTLCRFVLVTYGIEGYSASECARILGIGTTVIEAAYSVVLEGIELYSFEAFVAEAADEYAGS
jgi:DNA-directed RNA polymerase specialized sigma24 family protein